MWNVILKFFYYYYCEDSGAVRMLNTVPLHFVVHAEVFMKKKLKRLRNLELP